MSRQTLLLSLTLVALMTLPGAISAQSLGPLVVDDRPAVAIGDRAAYGPTVELEPLARLAPAPEVADDELGAMRQWNLEDRLPLQVGFPRPLQTSRAVRLDPAHSDGAIAHVAGGVVSAGAGDTVVWSGAVEVDGAWRLRLHLRGVALPPGTEMVVSSADGSERVAFGLAMRAPDGELWSPSVAGPRIELQVRVPRGALEGGPGFTIVGVGEVFRLDERGVPLLGREPRVETRGSECIQDASCFDDDDLTDLETLRQAVFRASFVAGGRLGSCTGALLNNTAADGTPYALTANHCFSTQSAAASLEAFFDYRTSSCDGSLDPSAMTRVGGATLLESRSISDFTFLRLSSRPAGEFALLGWNVARAQDGTELHRVCHANGGPQRYSRATVRILPSELVCEGVSQDRFLYQRYDPDGVGGTAGGCSGSASVDAQLRVRGQLLGGCGPEPTDVCNRDNADVDGSFHVTYGFIDRWLAPQTGGDDATGTRIQFEDADLLTHEGDGVALVAVERVGGTNGAVAVDYAATSEFVPLAHVDPADAGTDFTATEGTLRWADGVGAKKRFAVEIIDDEQIEDIESLTLVLSNPTSGAVLGSRDLATLRIGDDDTDATDCTADATTLCLNEDGRFRATLRFSTADAEGVGQAVEIGKRDSGLFFFFDDENIEMLLKVLDACRDFDRYWVFYAATTNVGFTLDVEDTAVGSKKQYFNPRGQVAAPMLDTDAFPCTTG